MRNFKSIVVFFMASSLAYGQKELPSENEIAASKNEVSEVNATASESSPRKKPWADAEFLLWWMRGQNLPAIATTNPIGTSANQAGILGAPGTSTIIGGSWANDGLRTGGKFSGGYWFENMPDIAIEADFFFLQNLSQSYNSVSDGSTILARPFTNALDGAPSAVRIAYPGDVSGSISAQVATNGFVGGGIGFRQNLTAFQTNNFRLDALVGYRAMTFSDKVNIDSNLTSINPDNANFVAVGTTINASDRFSSSNTFNGFDTGFAGEYNTGKFSFQSAFRIALGMTQSNVKINGSTTTFVPGTDSISSVGGLYALSSNIGDVGNKAVSIIPQVNTRAGYMITDSLKASLGYNFLIWTGVVRSANMIDTTINPNLIPNSSTTGGPQRPSLSMAQSSIWAQGLNFSLEYNY
jgi:Putative beta barrel porin-7 (BBP7)